MPGEDIGCGMMMSEETTKIDRRAGFEFPETEQGLGRLVREVRALLQ